MACYVQSLLYEQKIRPKGHTKHFCSDCKHDNSFEVCHKCMLGPPEGDIPFTEELLHFDGECMWEART